MKLKLLSFFGVIAAMTMSAYSAVATAVVPAGYTQVDYIESTGTQYIDTDITVKDNTTVEADMQLTEINKNGVGFFGIAGGNQRLCAYISGGGKISCCIGSADWKSCGNQDADLDRHTLVLSTGNGGFFKLDNVEYPIASGYSIPSGKESSKTIPLGARYNNGYNPVKCRIYGAQISEGAVRVADFVPCYRDYDGVRGLYDIVRNRFFTNCATSGDDFISSWLNEGLPAAYAPLSYIESTGTQYIDTGIKVKNNTTVEVDMQLTEIQGGRGYFGVIDGNQKLCAYISGSSTGSGGISYCLGTTQWKGSGKNADTRRHTFVLSTRNGGSFTIDEESVSVSVTIDPTHESDKSIPLGARYYSGNYNLVKCRIYDAKISEGDTPVTDLVPCYRKSDMKRGLFDRVRGKLLVNKADGDDFKTPGVYYVSYIESTGTQYIDTGIKVKNNTTVEADMQLTEVQGGRGYFGVDSNKQKLCAYISGSSIGSGGISYCLGTTQWKGSGKNADTGRHTFVLSTRNGGAFTIDEESIPVSVTIDSALESDKSIPLGARYYSGYYNLVKCRIYDAKISEGDTPVVDFWPTMELGGNIGLADAQNGNAFYGNRGSGVFAWGGIKYQVTDSTLKILEGTLSPSDVSSGYGAPYACVEVLDGAAINAAATTAYPGDLIIGAGTFSLANGEINDYTVSGNLTIKGGAKIEVDITDSGNDRFVLGDGGAITLDATAENPIEIVVPGVEEILSQDGFAILPSGLAADDVAKFVLPTGFRGKLVIKDGKLVLKSLDQPIIDLAHWSNGGGNGNWSSIGNWEENALPRKTAVFDLVDGGETTIDVGYLRYFSVLSAVVQTSEAGSFIHNGDAAFTVNAITNLSANGQTFNVPVTFGKTASAPAEVHVAQAGTTTLHATDANAKSFRKTGAGTLVTGDGVIAAANQVTVEQGTLKLAERQTSEAQYLDITTSTSRQLVWRNVRLADIVGIRAVTASPSISYGAALPYQPFFYVYDSATDTVTVDLQIMDDGCTKGVELKFEQDGNDVYVTRTYSCYKDKAELLGTQKIRELGSNVGNYDAKNIRPVCYSRDVLQTNWTTIWRGVNLADVTGVSARMCGSSIDDLGKTLISGTAFFWKPAAENDGIATVQIQVLQGTNEKTCLKGVFVSFRQNGADVEAMVTDARYLENGELGTDLTGPNTQRQGYKASTMTATGYGVYDVCPLVNGVECDSAFIKIESGAQLDLNMSDGYGADVKNESVHGKTVFIAGNGPDGSGALVNSVLRQSGGWGCMLGKLVLTDDAMIGGGHISVRPLSNSRIANPSVTGHDYVLTIANANQGEPAVFSDVTFDLKRIDVTGKLKIGSGPLNGNITEGIHLAADGAILHVYNMAELPDWLALTADTNVSANMTVQGDSTTLLGPLTLKAGSTLVLQSGKKAVANGRLNGSGALKGDFTMGTNGIWQVVLGAHDIWATDLTEVTDSNAFVKSVKKLQVVLKARAELAKYPLCAVDSLADDDLAEITLDVQADAGAIRAVTEGWCLRIENKTIYLVNPRPNALTIFIR